MLLAASSEKRGAIARHGPHQLRMREERRYTWGGGRCVDTRYTWEWGLARRPRARELDEGAGRCDVTCGSAMDAVTAGDTEQKDDSG